MTRPAAFAPPVVSCRAQYSDDLGMARLTPCSPDEEESIVDFGAARQYGVVHEDDDSIDIAGLFLPLVNQSRNSTVVAEQPLDFTTLAQK